MEDRDVLVNASNFNEDWNKNIFENIKKIEEYERFAREGCNNLLEYVQMPFQERTKQIGIIQYKNLRFLITEFKLLLGDLSPILEEKEEKIYLDWIKKVDEIINNQELFITCYYDLNNQISESNLTNFFYVTINTFYDLKVRLFRQIKKLLYAGLNNE